MATYTRENAWNNGGTFANTDLLWYAKGVGIMQARKLSDPSSWWFFAAIHGEYVSDAKFPGWGFLPSPPAVPTSPLPAKKISDRYWNQCQHQSWYFPPWHRGYLLALEAQIRAAVIGLGGPANWALPYWDYFGPGQECNIPPAFTSTTLPDNGPNPLYVKARYGPDGNGDIWVPTAAGIKQHPKDPNLFGEVTQDVLSDDLYTGSDAGTKPPGFGGPATVFTHQGQTSGNLENNPHNLVHSYVGGSLSNSNYGLMSDPGLAALDPIFYLHHCNIDRMWAIWNQKHANPSDSKCPADFQWQNGPAAFGERKFVMPMPNGEWEYTPQQMSSLSQLNYAYDSLPKLAPVADPLTQRLTRLGAATTGARAKGVAGGTVELLGANDEPLAIKGEGASTAVKLESKVRGKVSASLATAAESAAPDRVYLNLENVRGTHDAAVLSVYVNLPRGANPKNHPELLAGSVGLFGLRRASMADGRQGGQGLSFILDITKIVDSLYLKNGFDVNSLNVSVLPHRSVPDRARITVGRISIYRQGR